MKRRDLLLLKTSPGTRVLELACAGLYMRYLGTQRPSGPETVLDDYWLGEPEPRVATPSARELFDGLERDLAGADVLRVVEPHWLAAAELRQEVDALVDQVRHPGDGRDRVRPAYDPREQHALQRHAPVRRNGGRARPRAVQERHADRRLADVPAAAHDVLEGQTGA